MFVFVFVFVFVLATKNCSAISVEEGTCVKSIEAPVEEKSRVGAKGALAAAASK